MIAEESESAAAPTGARSGREESRHMPSVDESPSTAVSAHSQASGEHDALLLQATQRILVIRRILELTVKRLKSDEHTGGHHMGEGQYHVLHALYDQPRLMAGELAQRLHV